MAGDGMDVMNGRWKYLITKKSYIGSLNSLCFYYCSIRSSEGRANKSSLCCVLLRCRFSGAYHIRLIWLHVFFFVKKRNCKVRRPSWLKFIENPD